MENALSKIFIWKLMEKKLKMSLGKLLSKNQLATLKLLLLILKLSNSLGIHLELLTINSYQDSHLFPKNGKKYLKLKHLTSENKK